MGVFGNFWKDMSFNQFYPHHFLIHFSGSTTKMLILVFWWTFVISAVVISLQIVYICCRWFHCFLKSLDKNFYICTHLKITDRFHVHILLYYPSAILKKNIKIHINFSYDISFYLLLLHFLKRSSQFPLWKTPWCKFGITSTHFLASIWVA